MREIIHKVVSESANDQYNLRETLTADIIKNKFLKQIEQNEITELIVAAYEYGVELALNVKKRTEEKHEVYPKCSKGCYYCCVFPVPIIPVEAKIIVDRINKFDLNKKKVLRQKLKDAKKLIGTNIKVRRNTHEFHDQYIEAKIYCPFLDDETKSCSIYDARPLSCLNYFEYESNQKCMHNPISDTANNYEDLKFTVIYTIRRALDAYAEYHNISKDIFENRYLDMHNSDYIPFMINSNDIL